MHTRASSPSLAAAVGPEGRVVAIEAAPHNARVARRNLALNGVRNVHVVDGAVAVRRGTVRFEENLGGRIVDRARGTIEVTASTIDDLVADFGEPDVVFIDIEGAEAAALAGARRTLEGGRATWFVEVHQGLGLEPRGWPAPAEVLSHFPLDRYDNVVAVENEDKTHSFRSLAASAPEGRFFMVGSPIEPVVG